MPIGKQDREVELCSTLNLQRKFKLGTSTLLPLTLDRTGFSSGLSDPWSGFHHPLALSLL